MEFSPTNRILEGRQGRSVMADQPKAGGHSFLVPETDIEHKTDEPYCTEFVKEAQQASLVRKMVKKVVRERVVTPTYEKGFLKSGGNWKYKGQHVNRLQVKVLNETYERLVQAQAAVASAGK